MAIDARKAATVDPEFEIFFREVGEAVRMVEADRSKTIDLEKGTRKARIVGFEDHVDVYISEVEPKQPALMVP